MNKKLRIDTKNQIKLILIYEICLLVFGSLYLRYRNINMTELLNSSELMTTVGQSGVPYFWGIGAFFLIIYLKKLVSIKTIFSENKKMNIRSFLSLFLLLMSAQGIINIVSTLLEKILSTVGYTFLPSLEAASSTSSTISLFISVSFIAPIAEEVLFRGIILNNLKKYGKIFSIVVSAIFFGVIHANVYQSIYAILIGIILGYIAVEFSLKWAIIFHIINNFIFGELLQMALNQYSTDFQNLFLTILFAFFLIGAIAIIIQKQDFIKHYIQKNKPENELYRIAFSSFWVRIYIAFQLLFAFSQITKP